MMWCNCWMENALTRLQTVIRNSVKSITYPSGKNARKLVVPVIQKKITLYQKSNDPNESKSTKISSKDDKTKRGHLILLIDKLNVNFDHWQIKGFFFFQLHFPFLSQGWLMNCCPLGLWSLAGHDDPWHLTPGDSEPWKISRSRDEFAACGLGQGGHNTGITALAFYCRDEREKGKEECIVPFPFSSPSSCGIWWCYLYQRHLPIVTAVRTVSRDTGYIYQAQTQFQITSSRD